MFKRISILLLGFFLLSTALVKEQSSDTNAHIKAIFIYNFTKYVEWPKNYKEGNFVITILGNSSGMLQELTRLASLKAVGTQPIEIKNLSTLEGIPNKCHILFIPSGTDIKIAEAVAKLKGKNTLIITEKTGSIKQGSAINFVVVENKQRFELNKTNAEKYELKVSGTLQTLAIMAE